MAYPQPAVDKGKFAAIATLDHRGWAYHAVSRACLLLGRLDEARRLGHRSIESSQRQPGFAAHGLFLLGDIATHLERFDAESAAAHYREALRPAHLHGMRPVIAHCHLGLGRLYRRTGQPEHAHKNLTAAMAMYREMDMGFWLERGEAEMTNSGHMEARLRPIAKILGQTGDSAIASDIFHIFR